LFDAQNWFKLAGKTSFSKLTKVEANSFKAAVVEKYDNERQNTLRVCVTNPFQEFVNNSGGGIPAPANEDSNSHCNKVALMAHLIVAAEASELWQKLHEDVAPPDKSAYMEQTGGIRGGKEDIAAKLISVAHSIKNDLDLSKFAPDLIGCEASNACASINASAAEFQSGSELLSMVTTMVNLHDTLLSHLDASGSAVPDSTPIVSVSRRIKCYTNFLGQHGRSKNMSVFYCFVLWEGCDTKFITRTLKDCGGRSSSSTSTSTPQHLTKDAVFKRKLGQIADAFGSPLAAAPGQTPSPPVQPVVIPPVSPGAADRRQQLLLESKLRKLDAEENTVKENGLSIKASKLLSAISSEAFSTFDAETKDKIKAAYVASLIN
jgi:hypothetical protein